MGRNILVDIHRLGRHGRKGQLDAQNTNFNFGKLP